VVAACLAAEAGRADRIENADCAQGEDMEQVLRARILDMAQSCLLPTGQGSSDAADGLTSD
jgi:hypothetical protein